jgi:effector-binding domain-containing protein
MRANAGETPERRNRGRTLMSSIRLVLAAATVALGAGLACAQNAPPQSGERGPAPTPPAVTGPASPSPLQPGDAFGEPVTLPERTIVYIKGHSNWDSAFETLVDSFKSLHEYLDKQNIKPSGPAITIYTQTDDTGFSFQAALPISQPPKEPPKGDISVGPAPSGKALKFVHRGSYDAMDTTYEAITNYLDDKQLEAKDLFIEEYATDPVTSDPSKLVVNVFVPVK